MILDELNEDQRERLKELFSVETLNESNFVEVESFWSNHDYKLNKDLFIRKKLPIHSEEVWK